MVRPDGRSSDGRRRSKQVPRFHDAHCRRDNTRTPRFAGRYAHLIEHENETPQSLLCNNSTSKRHLPFRPPFDALPPQCRVRITVRRVSPYTHVCHTLHPSGPMLFPLRSNDESTQRYPRSSSNRRASARTPAYPMSLLAIETLRTAIPLEIRALTTSCDTHTRGSTGGWGIFVSMFCLHRSVVLLLNSYIHLGIDYTSPGKSFAMPKLACRVRVRGPWGGEIGLADLLSAAQYSTG